LKGTYAGVVDEHIYLPSLGMKAGGVGQACNVCRNDSRRDATRYHLFGTFLEWLSPPAAQDKVRSRFRQTKRHLAS
jgi:hypothetical protein